MIDIRSSGDLLAIGHHVDFPLDGDYALLGDIDMGGAFMPNKSIFTGTFDGHNHTISNMTGYCLFPIVQTAFDIYSSDQVCIRNLTLDNCDVTSSEGSYHGGLVGQWYGSHPDNLQVSGTGNARYSPVIYNCHIKNATISSEDSVGGLVGECYTNLCISSCSVKNIQITSQEYGGGFVGRALSGRTSSEPLTLQILDSVVQNTQVRPNNTSEDVYIGGFVGYSDAYEAGLTYDAALNDNVQIITSQVIDCQLGVNTSSPTTDTYVGGFIGHAACTTDTNSNSYTFVTGCEILSENSSCLIGSDYAKVAAGVIGYVETHMADISIDSCLIQPTSITAHNTNGYAVGGCFCNVAANADVDTISYVKVLFDTEYIGNSISILQEVIGASTGTHISVSSSYNIVNQATTPAEYKYNGGSSGNSSGLSESISPANKTNKTTFSSFQFVRYGKIDGSNVTATWDGSTTTVTLANYTEEDFNTSWQLLGANSNALNWAKDFSPSSILSTSPHLVLSYSSNIVSAYHGKTVYTHDYGWAAGWFMTPTGPRVNGCFEIPLDTTHFGTNYTNTAFDFAVILAAVYKGFVKLTADIDCSAFSYRATFDLNAVSYTYSLMADQNFSGKINGDGHKLKNLTLDTDFVDRGNTRWYGITSNWLDLRQHSYSGTNYITRYYQSIKNLTFSNHTYIGDDDTTWSNINTTEFSTIGYLNTQHFCLDNCHWEDITVTGNKVDVGLMLCGYSSSSATIEKFPINIMNCTINTTSINTKVATPTWGFSLLGGEIRVSNGIFTNIRANITCSVTGDSSGTDILAGLCSLIRNVSDAATPYNADNPSEKGVFCSHIKSTYLGVWGNFGGVIYSCSHKVDSGAWENTPVDCIYITSCDVKATQTTVPMIVSTGFMSMYTTYANGGIVGYSETKITLVDCCADSDARGWVYTTTGTTDDRCWNGLLIGGSGSAMSGFSYDLSRLFITNCVVRGNTAATIGGTGTNILVTDPIVGGTIFDTGSNEITDVSWCSDDEPTTFANTGSFSTVSDVTNVSANKHAQSAYIGLDFFSIDYSTLQTTGTWIMSDDRDLLLTPVTYGTGVPILVSSVWSDINWTPRTEILYQEDFAKIGVSSGWELDGDYILGTNITFSDDYYHIPIGKLGAEFTGSLEGAGYSLRNVHILPTYIEANVGFFGVVDGAEITNVNLEINVPTTNLGESLGGLVGLAIDATIQNCTLTCTLSASSTATQHLGCFIGACVGTEITACSVSATELVTIASGIFGAFAGYITDSTISKCTAEVDFPVLTGTGCSCFVGEAAEANEINSCTYLGKLLSGTIQSFSAYALARLGILAHTITSTSPSTLKTIFTNFICRGMGVLDYFSDSPLDPPADIMVKSSAVSAADVCVNSYISEHLIESADAYSIDILAHNMFWDEQSFPKLDFKDTWKASNPVITCKSIGDYTPESLELHRYSTDTDYWNLPIANPAQATLDTCITQGDYTYICATNSLVSTNILSRVNNVTEAVTVLVTTTSTGDFADWVQIEDMVVDADYLYLIVTETDGKSYLIKCDHAATTRSARVEITTSVPYVNGDNKLFTLTLNEDTLSIFGVSAPTQTGIICLHTLADCTQIWERTFNKVRKPIAKAGITSE